jgi:hypothetical protein
MRKLKHACSDNTGKWSQFSLSDNSRNMNQKSLNHSRLENKSEDSKKLPYKAINLPINLPFGRLIALYGNFFELSDASSNLERFKLFPLIIFEFSDRENCDHFPVPPSRKSHVLL